MSQEIKRVFALTITDDDGNEFILADNRYVCPLPMLMSDTEGVPIERMHESAQELAEHYGRAVSLVEFTERKTLGTFDPLTIEKAMPI